MRRGLYRRLAGDGIRKNGSIYLPYFLTCTGMVMMFYIVAFLAMDPKIRGFEGGATLQSMLGLGVMVMGIFAFIFLIYTSSFLMRRRKKEFGLYHMLGMGKGNLLRILLWENIFLAASSLAAGLFCGILFSKIGELLLVRMLENTPDFDFTVSPKTAGLTLEVFGAVFLIVFLKALLEMLRLDPAEMFRGSAQGEKPPRANWLMALAGLALLGGAYRLALVIEDPLTAMLWFFGAVAMVIVGTYLLFMAGSVALCRILQKNRRYYYRTNHFISVSSMAYRMKKNGAGLASICILSTMVLVMLSAVTCMYVGIEDSLRTRYPRNLVVEAYTEDMHAAQLVREETDRTVRELGEEPQNILSYQYLEITAYQQESTMRLNNGSLSTAQSLDFANVREVFVIPLEDYNRVMGEDAGLPEGEALLYCTKGNRYPYDSFTIEGCGTWKIAEIVPEFVSNGMETAQISTSYFLFVPTMEEFEQINAVQREVYGEYASTPCAYYGFDLGGSAEEQKAVTEAVRSRLEPLAFPEESVQIRVEGMEQERIDTMGMYSGLFFVGILLGIIFVAGTVLIMYYKQITEGYEDQKRFEVLQKVGMTRREIKKSINSQILTVFFLPLLTAGIHTGFAFPFVKKILVFFSVNNTLLLVCVTVGCYLIFAVFYVLVYLATSRVYYRIVSGGEKEKER